MGPTTKVSAVALLIAVLMAVSPVPSPGIAQECVWERREDGELELRDMNENLDDLIRDLRRTDRPPPSERVRELAANKIGVMLTFPRVELEPGGEAYSFYGVFTELEQTDLWLDYALLREATPEGEAGDARSVASALRAAIEFGQGLEERFVLPRGMARKVGAMNRRLEALRDAYTEGDVDRRRLRREIDAIVDIKKEIIESIGPVFSSSDEEELISFRSIYRLLYRIDLALVGSDEPQVFRAKSSLEWLSDARLFKERLEARLREAGCLGEPVPEPAPPPPPPR